MNKYLLLVHRYLLYYSGKVYPIEDVEYKHQKTEAQLQAALQRVMELNNGKYIQSTIYFLISCVHHEMSYVQIIQYYCLENESFKKICVDNDKELGFLKTKEKSSQERVQSLEDKISLLTRGRDMCLLILYHCKC